MAERNKKGKKTAGNGKNEKFLKKDILFSVFLLPNYHKKVTIE